MRGTLRMPKAMVAASKLRSANGSASAFASAKVTAVAKSARSGALAADRQHVGIDVADRRARALAAGREHAQRDVAGAAGDVEERERPAFRRIDRRHQRILPGAMQAERHQVVHQVVAARDAVEYVVDQRLLVVRAALSASRNGRYLARPVRSFDATIARRRKRRYVSKLNHVVGDAEAATDARTP